MEISFSAIKAYLDCPWKYKLVYKIGRYVPQTPPSSLGKSIHKALEAFYLPSPSMKDSKEGLGLNKGDSLDMLLECYDKHWVNEGFTSAQQTQEFYEKGAKILDDYWKQNSKLNSEVIFVEKEFNISLGNDNLRGTIDRIDRLPDGRYELIEYKTHAELWDKQRIEKDLQLSLYAFACRESFNIAPAVLSYYFLSHNCKLNTERSEEQIKDALDLTGSIIRKIQKNEFEPNHDYCSICDFKEGCANSVYIRSK